MGGTSPFGLRKGVPVYVQDAPRRILISGERRGYLL
jgi:prolyl-tRNA editing enzyme YbaK/EbsC (Cys-tRNA(Pro) deacylase)